jgi:predicted Zn-dependent protease
VKVCAHWKRLRARWLLTIECLIAAESTAMDTPFDPHASIHAPACRCALHSRRLFTAALATGAVAPALAQREGVEVGKQSRMASLVPAEQVEAAATQQYEELKREAASKRALAPAGHPQMQRLRTIAERLIPHALNWNPRARNWRWEVNLIGSKELNAFCMPGGKIAFFYGLLDKLKLNDDEVAMIMGHEMAHALREHARERLGKNAATRIGAGVLSALLGLGQTGDALLNMGGQLLSLRFGREDESEADLIGMEIAARAGYDPRAGVTLWQKMMNESRGAPPEFLSTHPAGATRIREIQENLPRVEPLYARAPKPDRQFGPPNGPSG